MRLLESIERERFDQLPGGVFRTSFVRQYAQAVGLDEAQTVAEFKRLSPPQESNLEEHFGIEPSKSRIEIPFDLAKIAEDATELYRRHRPLVAVVLSACLALLLGTTVYWAWPTESGGDSASTAARPSAGEPSLASTAPLPGDATRDEGIQVELSILEKVWVRATADGKRVWERTLRRGDQRSIEAAQSIRLLVGNAGGLTVELNGRPMPRIGPRGHVRRVLFTSSGMRVVEPRRAAPSDTTTTASLVSSILSRRGAPILARAGR